MDGWIDDYGIGYSFYRYGGGNKMYSTFNFLKLGPFKSQACIIRMKQESHL